MGLASKLAASGGYPPSGGAPPPGGSYPGQQQQYQAYSGAQPPQHSGVPPPQGAPPSLQPGAQPPYPPQSSYIPQNQYSRPPPPPPPSGGPQSTGYGQQPAYGQQPPYGQQPAYGQQSPYSQQLQYGQQTQHGQAAPQQNQNFGPYGPPQQTYGQQQPQQYGAPPTQQAGPGAILAYKQLLQQCIQDNGLQNFYPPNSPVLDQVANRAAAQVDQICARWRLPREVGNDIVKLALFDIILYVDDSGSMAFEEAGERISDLRLILQRVAYAATLFDEDGVSIRFMNQACAADPRDAPRNGDELPVNLVDHVRTDQQVEQLMSHKKFTGLTPMGSQLKTKVLEGIIAKGGRKPFLVITITDGQPAGEQTNAVFSTIKEASTRFPRGTVNFAFAQVGNDAKAREFLGKLDNDPEVGNLVDCTSNFENESDEMRRLSPPVELTPELWLMKLLLGAIDHSYDRKDEKAGSGPPSGPPGGYGAPPPGQYGALPPQQYGGYPSQQYGASQNQGGAPQQQQYGAPQGQYPPQGYPPQGYPSQQQGYGQQRPPQQGYPGQGQQGYPGQQSYQGR